MTQLGVAAVVGGLAVFAVLAWLLWWRDRQCIKLEAENRQLRIQLDGTGTMMEQMKQVFENLSNAALERTSQRLSELNKTELTRTIDPLREQITSFRKKTEEIHETGVRDHTELTTQLEKLSTMNERLGAEATALTRALKGESKVRGDWGEETLLRILELSGLKKDTDYAVQPSVTDEEGRRLRPDVVVYLPDKRAIVIDSKLNLVDWVDYMGSQDRSPADAGASRAPSPDDFLERHANAVQRHLNQLAKKEYHELLPGHKLDYTLMFVPIEAALEGARQLKPGLYEDAFRKGIIIVSQSTLVLALGIVSQMWRVRKQQLNAAEIAEQGKMVYEKACLFKESMDDIGKHVAQARDSWEEGVKRLHKGQGNLVSQAKKLLELGISSQKSLE